MMMSDDILTYLPALRAFARSLCGNATEADDLVQETLLRAIENISGYTPGTNLRAWPGYCVICRVSEKHQT